MLKDRLNYLLCFQDKCSRGSVNQQSGKERDTPAPFCHMPLFLSETMTLLEFITPLCVMPLCVCILVTGKSVSPSQISIYCLWCIRKNASSWGFRRESNSHCLHGIFILNIANKILPNHWKCAKCYLRKALHMGVAVKLLYLWVSDHGQRQPYQTHIY